jgi:hypothetical protein
MQRKLLAIIREDYAITDPLLIIHSAFVKYLKKMGIQCSRGSATYTLQESL